VKGEKRQQHRFPSTMKFVSDRMSRLVQRPRLVSVNGVLQQVEEALNSNGETEGGRAQLVVSRGTSKVVSSCKRQECEAWHSEPSRQAITRNTKKFSAWLKIRLRASA
jgi:hypothetical protein